MSNKVIQPEGWLAPKGYANGVEARGRQIYVGGQIGWNAQCQFETDDLVLQIKQALQNCVDVVRAAGGGPEHLVRMTWYLEDKKEYVARLKEIGAVLGISESRVCQLHGQALVRLRARLRSWNSEHRE